MVHPSKYFLKVPALFPNSFQRHRLHSVTLLPVTQIKTVEKNDLFLKEICSRQPSPV